MSELFLVLGVPCFGPIFLGPIFLGPIFLGPKFFGPIFWTNLTKFLMNILINSDFSVDFSLTYNLLTVAKFRIGVPSILLYVRTHSI